MYKHLRKQHLELVVKEISGGGYDSFYVKLMLNTCQFYVKDTPNIYPFMSNACQIYVNSHQIETHRTWSTEETKQKGQAKLTLGILLWQPLKRAVCNDLERNEI